MMAPKFFSPYISVMVNGPSAPTPPIPRPKTVSPIQVKTSPSGNRIMASPVICRKTTITYDQRAVIHSLTVPNKIFDVTAKKASSINPMAASVSLKPICWRCGKNCVATEVRANCWRAIPIDRNQKALVRIASPVVNPSKAALAALPASPVGVQRFLTSLSTSSGRSRITRNISSRRPTNNKAVVANPHRHPPKAMTAVMIGTEIIPPKLFPDAMMPIMRPRMVGNHKPTSLPTGSIEVPGVAMKISALNA